MSTWDYDYHLENMENNGFDRADLSFVLKGQVWENNLREMASYIERHIENRPEHWFGLLEGQQNVLICISFTEKQNIKEIRSYEVIEKNKRYYKTKVRPLLGMISPYQEKKGVINFEEVMKEGSSLYWMDFVNSLYKRIMTLDLNFQTGEGLGHLIEQGKELGGFENKDCLIRVRNEEGETVPMELNFDGRGNLIKSFFMGETWYSENPSEGSYSHFFTRFSELLLDSVTTVKKDKKWSGWGHGLLTTKDHAKNIEREMQGMVVLVETTPTEYLVVVPMENYPDARYQFISEVWKEDHLSKVNLLFKACEEQGFIDTRLRKVVVY